MATRQKKQLNASIDPQYHAQVHQFCTTEGRKLGEIVERMIEVYDGSPQHLLERLKRLRKAELGPDDKAALRDMQDQLAFLLFSN